MKKQNVFVMLSLIFIMAASVFAYEYEKNSTFTPDDPFYGDYIGKLKIDGSEQDGRALVIAEKHEDKPFQYQVMLIDKDRNTKVHLFGQPQGDHVPVEGERNGKRWKGQIKDKMLTVATEDNSRSFTGAYTVRDVPGIGAKAPNNATVLIPYKEGGISSLDMWRNRRENSPRWDVPTDGSCSIQVGEGSGDIVSTKTFGAIQIHAEFCNPYKCYDFGQGRGNSGLYFHGRYEVQVLESFGMDLNPGNCGGIYNNARANVIHVPMPPAHWQVYEVTFLPPIFGPDNNKVLDPRLSVIHNGIEIHKNVDLKNVPTPSAMADNIVPRAPMMLQDHSNPVRFRNMWYVDIKDDRKLPDGLNKDSYLNKFDEILRNAISNKDANVINNNRFFIDNMYNLNAIIESKEIERRLLDFIKSDVPFEAKQAVFAELNDLVDNKQKQTLADGLTFPTDDYMKSLNGILDGLAKFSHKGDQNFQALEVIVRYASNNKNVVDLTPAIEKRFNEFLKSDATLPGKQVICRQLLVVASENSIDTLAAMLPSDKTVDMALYAMENIESEKVDVALRSALGKADAGAKIAIVNSLGRRGDVESVKTISKLMYDSDEVLASASIRALGNIADKYSTKYIARAKRKIDGPLSQEVFWAYLKCADKLVKSGEKSDAYKIYEDIYEDAATDAIKCAALVGMVDSNDVKAGKELLRALKGDNIELQETAASIVDKLSDRRQVGQVISAMNDLSVNTQVQILSSLSRRGDQASRDAVLAAIKSDKEDVKVAGLVAMAKVGDASDVMMLVNVAADNDGRVRQSAVSSLDAIDKPDVDKTIVENIPSAKGKVKVILIVSARTRQSDGAVPTLLEAASDADGQVRKQAYKGLAAMAGENDMAALVKVVLKSDNKADLDSGEKAIVATAKRIGDVNARGQAIWPILPSVQDSSKKAVLLRALGKMGDRNALAEFRKALKSGDAELQKVAIKVLDGWHNPEPMADLVEAAKNTGDETCNVLAIRAFLKLSTKSNDMNPQETTEILAKAFDASRRADEKKLVLNRLTDVLCQEALDFAQSKESDGAVGANAKAAARIIRNRMEKKNFSVEASHNNNNARNAIDENIDSRWDTGTAMKPGFWFILDMNKEMPVSGVIYDASKSGGDYPRGYEVYVTTDKNNWGEAVAKGEGKTAVVDVDFGRCINGRYIKIVQTGETEGTFWSIHEIYIK